MVKFNVESSREKGGLRVFNDIAVVLKYLYSSKDNFIEHNGHHIVMDADKNILIRPQQVNDTKVTKSTNDLPYICQNEIDYLTLTNIVEKLQQDGRMEEIRMSVMYSESM